MNAPSKPPTFPAALRRLAASARAEVARHAADDLRSHEPYEVILARRAEELDASYAALLCAVRTVGLGRTVAYDPATHTIVEAWDGCEVHHPAGRFEGWSP